MGIPQLQEAQPPQILLREIPCLSPVLMLYSMTMVELQLKKPLLMMVLAIELSLVRTLIVYLPFGHDALF